MHHNLEKSCKYVQCHPSNKFFFKVLSGCIFLFCATPHNWNIWRRRALSVQDLRHRFSSRIKTFEREIRCTLIHFKRCTNNGDYAAPLVKRTWRGNIDFVCVLSHAFVHGIKADSWSSKRSSDTRKWAYTRSWQNLKLRSQDLSVRHNLSWMQIWRHTRCWISKLSVQHEEVVSFDVFKPSNSHFKDCSSFLVWSCQLMKFWVGTWFIPELNPEPDKPCRKP